MADSSYTKRTLAAAMKQLMACEPFSKISVGEICQACQMNRKSFYYHFQDKYDLVNWIFQTEFIAVVQRQDYSNLWDGVADLCRYFYENRAFYSNALSVSGQNSFSDYFREMLFPLLRSCSSELLSCSGDAAAADFFATFYSDAIIMSLLRWLSDRHCLPPEQYTARLRTALEHSDQILRRRSGAASLPLPL